MKTTVLNSVRKELMEMSPGGVVFTFPSTLDALKSEDPVGLILSGIPNADEYSITFHHRIVKFIRKSSNDR